jgi:FKBP-type peptidyl-prolyl cis-trans isomerase SlyD
MPGLRQIQPYDLNDSVFREVVPWQGSAKVMFLRPIAGALAAAFEKRSRMQISKDKVVTIDYTLTNPQGQVLDTSDGRQPLVYMQGVGNIIPGLERELEGKSTGDAVNVTIQPKDGYGERDEKMIQSVPRTAFQGVQDIQPGMQFQAQAPNGQRMIVRVVEVSDNEVKIDANHPLAGVPLTFAVTIRDVRDSTQEEKDHGHAHGPGGHHH